MLWNSRLNKQVTKQIPENKYVHEIIKTHNISTSHVNNHAIIFQLTSAYLILKIF